MVWGKVIFIIALILQIIIRYPYRNVISGQGVKNDQTDREEQLLLLLLTIGGMLLPFVYIFTGWLAFADYPPSWWLLGAGICVMAAALWLFWKAHAGLGRNWSPSLKIGEEHTLVTQGVYRRIRHPMYAAGWLIMAAQALLLPNWIAGFGGLVGFGLMYFLRVPKEERMMVQAFGEQYQHYMAQTGRIIPKRAVTP